ncbi:dihydrolipoamide acetyltransferase family protein [Microlunatus elymi]|nr:dihydrolipoamide acetyltransferase family protein [Microlunatus elymi]
MKQFRLPDPGEGLVEADIVSWHVAPGDQVKINDILLEVETSKSIVELPSPYAGTVTELLVGEGDTVDVGTPIITIDDGTSVTVPEPVERSGSTRGQEAAPKGPEPAEGQEAQPQQADPGKREPVLVGYGARAGSTKRRARKVADKPEEPHAAVADAFGTDHPVSYRHGEPAPLHPVPAEPVGDPLPQPGQPHAEPHPSGGRVLAKPPVRKLAKDLGVDLAAVNGSGPGGVITRDDVESAASNAPEPASKGPELVEGPESDTTRAPAPGRQDVRIPIKGVRKATAQAMVTSAFTAPHVTEWVTCDVSATMALVESIKARKEFAEVKVSPLLIIAKACLLALRRTPSMNSRWDEPAQEIVQHGAVNLGIAAATPRGLVVPKIKNADLMSLRELAGALQKLIMVAREGKSQPADLAGGTFTITNVGVFGVDAGTPILNPGESGILAVGAINRRPWVVGTGADERIEPRWVTTLAVSFDHRIVDGEQGSRFLADVAAILSDPATALLF